MEIEDYSSSIRNDIKPWYNTIEGPFLKDGTDNGSIFTKEIINTVDLTESIIGVKRTSWSLRENGEAGHGYSLNYDNSLVRNIKLNLRQENPGKDQNASFSKEKLKDSELDVKRDSKIKNRELFSSIIKKSRYKRKKISM